MITADTISINQIPQLLGQLQREKFYGRITFELRAGEISLVRTERTQLILAETETKSHRGVNRDAKELQFRT
jgi:hypothetical protein